MYGVGYIYLSSKIRVLETRLPDETDLERMLDAPDLATAFKVLNDTDYADNLAEIKPEDYRDVLRDDFQQMFDFFQKIIPQRALFDLIMLERDFVNLRLLFKAKYFEADVAEHIKENAVYPAKHLKDYVFENHAHPPEDLQKAIEGDGKSLDYDIKEVVYQVNKKITEKTAPDDIDAMLTQYYFDLKLKKAKDIGSKFIKKDVQMIIDTTNVLIWVRAKRMGLSKDQLKTKLINGGHADIKKLIALYPEETRGLKPFINANFDNKVNEVFEKFLEDDNLFELEKAFEDWKIRHARETKNFSYGPEVVYGYSLAKKNAVSNVSIILTGKLNKMPKEEIKKTLRETF